MKIIALTLLVGTVAVAAPAFGAADVDGPIRWHGNGQTVILHSSMSPTNLVQGDNPIGKPRTFVCRSAAGCVVTMSVSVRETNDPGFTTVCSYVDGTPGAPGCGLDPDYYTDETMSNANQQLKVGQGSHTITTVLNCIQAGVQMTGWQTQYTIYERRVPL